ncbi:hypothetical protein R1sor_000953 [Riccia sorocarpa]|uniref:CSC1-like protein n=1 Tax=Riccia sorocarpa TaxID=122646 RepID=A0ABD3GYT2_9MARC
MFGLSDVLASFAINGTVSVVLITLFSIFKNQPLNVRVYFSKWQLKGERVGPINYMPAVCPKGIRRYLNLDAKSYTHVMDWIKECLKMSEAELIDHGGLDAAVFLRLISLGLKIFIPLTVFGFIVLVPLNATDNQLAIESATKSNFTYDSLDRLTFSNISVASDRLWAHIVAAYLYTAWVLWLLFKEYRSVVALRFSFLASQTARQDQFTILCRCIPEDPKESIAAHVDHFFRFNHPDHYLMSQVVYDANKLDKMVKRRSKLQDRVMHIQGSIEKNLTKSRPRIKTGFWGLWGEEVDQLDYYNDEIAKLSDEIIAERTRILSDERSVMPAAFVSFDSRWGAAVCAQTVQNRDSSVWLTEWAPEPRDVYWANLPLLYNTLNSRKLAMGTLLLVLMIFFFFPISLVQAMANLAYLERNAPFLTPIVEREALKSLLQGYLSGQILKASLMVLPHVLMIMTKYEGHVSYSRIEKSATAKYFVFMVVNVFLGNVLVGTIFEQLKTFTEDPDRCFGVQIINCNEPKYESAAAYWPYMFGYIIVALLIKHITLMGLMGLKEAKSSTPFLLPLPICTILFYFYCKNRFEHAFSCYALEEAMAKDTIERASNPNLDVRSFLEHAYIHPSLRSVVVGNDVEAIPMMAQMRF